MEKCIASSNLCFAIFSQICLTTFIHMFIHFVFLVLDAADYQHCNVHTEEPMLDLMDNSF